MRRVLWAGLILLLVLVIALVLPVSRYALLGFLGNERLVNGRPVTYWLVAVKEAEDPQDRRQAALSLGEFDVCQKLPKDETRCRAVVVALAAALGDPDSFVRKCAATSFLVLPREATIAQESALVGRLVGALTDPEVAVRQAAARALWQVDPPPKGGEVVRVTEALRDKDDFVRAYATRVFARMGPDAKAAVPALLECLRQDEESDVRKLAGKALGLIGAQAIGPLLPETVKGLTQGLLEPSDEFREYAARALGQLGASEAIPALQKATKDNDERVRAAAAEALKRVASPVTEKGP